MSHSAPSRVLVSGWLSSHQFATIDLNGGHVRDEGERSNRVEGGASNSFLNPLMASVLMRLLFLAGGPARPLKDLNVSQRRKVTYLIIR
jgi:hypothetical protein